MAHNMRSQAVQSVHNRLYEGTKDVLAHNMPHEWHITRLQSLYKSYINATRCMDAVLVGYVGPLRNWCDLRCLLSAPQFLRRLGGKGLSGGEAQTLKLRVCPRP